MILGST